MEELKITGRSDPGIITRLPLDKSLNSGFALFILEEGRLARRNEEEPGLPSFFQANPWLSILAQRGDRARAGFRGLPSVLGSCG